MIKTGRDLRRLINSGGFVNIQTTPYERAGFWISMRDRGDRSRGFVSLKTLNRLLREMAQPYEQPERCGLKQGTVTAEIVSLKARVTALEDTPRRRSQTKRKPPTRESAPVDQIIDDIALGLTGKPFAKLRPMEQEAVRQLVGRVTVATN